MKTSILEYILKHPEQRSRLEIPISFLKIKDYGEAKVTRPSDTDWEWKRNWRIARLKISNNLMIMNENVTKIMKYYITSLKQTHFLEIPENHNWQTESLTKFLDIQKNQIDDEKKLVTDEWRRFVEELLKENRIYTDQLTIYFKSISGLMSSQMRELVVGSVAKYYNFIKHFKKKKYIDSVQVFKEQFYSKEFFERSFITICIDITPNVEYFTFTDDLKDIHARLVGLVETVVGCSFNIERPDNMFIKNLDKRSFLWKIKEFDIEIKLMNDEINEIVYKNLEMAKQALALYDPFIFALTEVQKLDKFKAMAPSREVIKQKITFYEEKLKILRENMPNFLYMNMFKINCTDVNTNLRTVLVGCIHDLLKYVEVTNIRERYKLLNDKVDKLKDKFTQSMENEEKLAKVEVEFEKDKGELIPEIYADYKDFVEWIFFYWSYDKYPVFTEKSVDSHSPIEGTIRNAYSTINLISNDIIAFENKIKEQKTNLENLLVKRRVELLEKIKEAKRAVDEIKEVAMTKIAEEIISTLKPIQINIDNLIYDLITLVKNETSLEVYPTEDDRLDLCKKEVDPWLNFLIFTTEHKEKVGDVQEIRSIDFQYLSTYIEHSSEILEQSTQKVNFITLFYIFIIYKLLLF